MKIYIWYIYKRKKMVAKWEKGVKYLVNMILFTDIGSLILWPDGGGKWDVIYQKVREINAAKKRVIKILLAFSLLRLIKDPLLLIPASCLLEKDAGNSERWACRKWTLYNSFFLLSHSPLVMAVISVESDRIP